MDFFLDLFVLRAECVITLRISILRCMHDLKKVPEILSSSLYYECRRICTLLYSGIGFNAIAIFYNDRFLTIYYFYLLNYYIINYIIILVFLLVKDKRYVSIDV